VAKRLDGSGCHSVWRPRRHCVRWGPRSPLHISTFGSFDSTSNDDNNYYYYYNIQLTAFFSRTTWVSWHQKGKPFWFYWSQRWWGGSGISWTIWKSFAPHSRQITTPVPHHSVFTGRMYVKPFSHLIHNCRYLYLNTDICILITDICSWNTYIFNLITDVCNSVHNYTYL